MASLTHRLEPIPTTLVTDVLRCMVGLSIMVTAGGSLFVPRLWSGLLAGSLVAIALFLVAMQTGRVLTRTMKMSSSMIFLQLAQVGVWIGMGVAIMECKVDPLGFVFSFSILPVAIVLTLAWYLLPEQWFHHE